MTLQIVYRISMNSVVACTSFVFLFAQRLVSHSVCNVARSTLGGSSLSPIAHNAIFLFVVGYLHLKFDTATVQKLLSIGQLKSRFVPRFLSNSRGRISCLSKALLIRDEILFFSENCIGRGDVHSLIDNLIAVTDIESVCSNF
jgi:hypothetical protein